MCVTCLGINSGCFPKQPETVDVGNGDEVCFL